MTKQEFETMAMRNNAEIGIEMYKSIERFYMCENDYHVTHGGIDETKQTFVKRVFGGKINTPKTIAKKIADESNKENRWCLRGNSAHTKDRPDQHEALIRNHYQTMLKYNM